MIHAEVDQVCEMRPPPEVLPEGILDWRVGPGLAKLDGCQVKDAERTARLALGDPMIAVEGRRSERQVQLDASAGVPTCFPSPPVGAAGAVTLEVPWAPCRNWAEFP
jgi:hypothetical protein